MRRFVTLITVFFFVSPSLAQVSDPALRGGEATFEGLGDLDGGDFSSEAYGVSADGSVIVGMSISEDGNEAFRWTEENGMIGLGDLPGGSFESGAYAVSSNGFVVVGSSDSNNGTEAFRWTESDGMVGLGALESSTFYSEARDVSADGSVVVGSSVSGNDGEKDFGEEAFRWENGTMEGLGDFPGGIFHSRARGVSDDGTVVVGYGNSENGAEAFQWEGGTMEGLGVLPGGAFGSVATSTSSTGSIVVGESESDDGNEAFLWTENDGMIGLGDLPGGAFQSAAHSISVNDAVVVGGYGNGFEAFIYTETEGMLSLKEMLENDYDLDLGDWFLVSVEDISTDGTTLVGLGVNPDGNNEAWRAVLPFEVADETTPEALRDVLSAPSPNPVNGTSTFTLAVEQGQHVAVEVFDVTGRHVQTVYEGTLAGGMSETLTLDASALPAGVYVVRATGEDFARTRRVTVVR